MLAQHYIVSVHTTTSKPYNNSLHYNGSIMETYNRTQTSEIHIDIKLKGRLVGVGAALPERSGYSTKGRTPKKRYFVAIYALF